jgi:ribosomal protein S18 acetylase RimI-like enzyme
MSQAISESGSAQPQISLRSVRGEDHSVLLEIYASTRADEMALVPWTVEQKEAFVQMQFAAQLEQYQKQFPEAKHDLIISDDHPVGRLYVAREKDRIEIIDITLLSQERNTGIGSYLLKELMNESVRKGVPLRIYVEGFNRSLRLFERLGFKPLAEQGVHILLEWSATTMKDPNDESA